jgi:hypothetical protein
MKKRLSTALLVGLFSCAASVALAAEATPDAAKPSIEGPVGLQLYSLRDYFAKDVPGTLDKVRDMDSKYVELAGTYDLIPEEFKKELDTRGLKARVDRENAVAEKLMTIFGEPHWSSDAKYRWSFPKVNRDVVCAPSRGYLSVTVRDTSAQKDDSA